MGIYKEKIPTSDKRLGRHIEHDDRSFNYKFSATGIKITDVEHKRFIPILNQGQVGACTGFAGIGDINTNPFIKNDNSYYTADDSGALKLYSDAEKIDGGIGYPPEDVGSSGLSIAKALKKQGLISSYQHTFNFNDALKALTKYPIITGIRWYSGMFATDSDGRVRISGKIVGGHEIEAFKIDIENARVWFYNSWGSQWGINGTFYLTWGDYLRLLEDRGDVTVLIPIADKKPELNEILLKIGSKGNIVKALQEQLNNTGSKLVIDGDFGPLTLQAVKDFQISSHLTVDGLVGKHTWAKINIVGVISRISIIKEIEPQLSVSVATCESSLNINATLYNKASNSTDRGLFQWNDYYHKEITDKMAFDPIIATELFCDAIKQGKLHSYWSASQHCWSKRLPKEILDKYNI